MNKELITLGGFMDLEGSDVYELKELGKKYHVEVYPALFESYELKGEATAIEAVTMAMWNMPREQWLENGLSEDSQQADREEAV